MSFLRGLWWGLGPLGDVTWEDFGELCGHLLSVAVMVLAVLFLALTVAGVAAIALGAIGAVL